MLATWIFIKYHYQILCNLIIKTKIIISYFEQHYNILNYFIFLVLNLIKLIKFFFTSNIKRLKCKIGQ